MNAQRTAPLPAGPDPAASLSVSSQKAASSPAHRARAGGTPAEASAHLLAAPPTAPADRTLQHVTNIFLSATQAPCTWQPNGDRMWLVMYTPATLLSIGAAAYEATSSGSIHPPATSASRRSAAGASPASSSSCPSSIMACCSVLLLRRPARSTGETIFGKALGKTPQTKSGSIAVQKRRAAVSDKNRPYLSPSANPLLCGAGRWWPCCAALHTLLPAGQATHHKPVSHCSCI